MTTEEALAALEKSFEGVSRDQLIENMLRMHLLMLRTIKRVEGCSLEDAVQNLTSAWDGLSQGILADQKLKQGKLS